MGDLCWKLYDLWKWVIIKPVKSIVQKYFGVFKIEKWYEDLDEFIIKVMRDWWSGKDMYAFAYRLEVTSHLEDCPLNFTYCNYCQLIAHGF